MIDSEGPISRFMVLEFLRGVPALKAIDASELMLSLARRYPEMSVRPQWVGHILVKLGFERQGELYVKPAWLNIEELYQRWKAHQQSLVKVGRHYYKQVETPNG
jgi:hypothetical protein